MSPEALNEISGIFIAGCALLGIFIGITWDKVTTAIRHYREARRRAEVEAAYRRKFSERKYRAEQILGTPVHYDAATDRFMKIDVDYRGQRRIRVDQ